MASNTKRRDRERTEVRERVLSAARDLIVKGGFEAVTMRAVADAVDYTPTALYWHFSDKEALIRALMDEQFLQFHQALSSRAMPADPVEHLAMIGRAYVEFGVEHPHHYRVMFMTPRPVDLEELVSCAAMEERAVTKGDPTSDAYAYLVSAVRRAIDAGRLLPGMTDADQVAQVFWAATHGIVSLHIAMGQHNMWLQWRDVRKTAWMLIDASLRGMLRDPRSWSGGGA